MSKYLTVSGPRPVAVILPALLVLFSGTVFLGGESAYDDRITFPLAGAQYAHGVSPLTTHQVLPVGRATRDEPVGAWSAIPAVPAELIDNETLWLARCIFSETKEPNEMELVAWVVRNRVETRYRGRSSYTSVVLDPFQFSAFNPGTTTRYFYSNLPRNARLEGWQEALSIAYLVSTDTGMRRPFPMTTRHFYSEVSMIGRRRPYWASGMEPVVPDNKYAIDERRFRFYDDVS